eukprot:2903148-Heterocapsa_arctica.AAC.1
MVARGSGGCHAVLICHAHGHIWATGGIDTERRLGKIMREAGLAPQTDADASGPLQAASAGTTQALIAAIGRL